MAARVYSGSDGIPAEVADDLGCARIHFGWTCRIWLGRLGVSEIISFHIAMPLLITGWFYFLGRVIDRWRHTEAAKGSPLARH
jgi:hypothetical protein